MNMISRVMSMLCCVKSSPIAYPETSCKTDAFKQADTWEESLEMWIQNAPQNERSARETAAETIRTCYAQESTRLDLSGNPWHSQRIPITSLQGVILPSKLESLDLSYTQINSLQGVTLPPNLKRLNLEATSITSLQGVSLPSSLERLTLRFTSIASFQGVTLPASLQYLNLSHTKITSLQEVVLLSNLQHLDLEDVKIRSLEGIIFPPSLKHLNLARMPITSLPESLARYPSTLELRTEYCHLNNQENKKFDDAINRAKSEDPSLGPKWITFRTWEIPAGMPQLRYSALQKC